MVLMLVVPAFAPWLTHEAIHAMHAVHDSHLAGHHNSGQHSHDYHNHDHKHLPLPQLDIHHPIRLDFVSYFQDYLHVDLKKPEQDRFRLQILDSDNFDLPLSITVYPKYFELAVIQSRSPPLYQSRGPVHIPIYLSTQRLRI